jgi:hypothetical protein
MSTPEDRLHHSRRLHQEDAAIQRQVKIARQRGLGNSDKAVEQPHRLAKKHAMDCGNPKCYLCSNPRHNGSKDKLTVQERRMYQDC